MRKTLSDWRRDVLLAHVDDALQAEQRADRGRGDAVLAGAGLGDDAALAHALRQQPLAERVVDLVRAGVGQVFALEVDLRAAQLARQRGGVVERRRPADISRQQPVQLGVEGRVVARLAVGGLQLGQRRHDCLRHELAAELAVTAAGVREAGDGGGVDGGHAGYPPPVVLVGWATLTLTLSLREGEGIGRGRESRLTIPTGLPARRQAPLPRWERAGGEGVEERRDLGRVLGAVRLDAAADVDEPGRT